MYGAILLAIGLLNVITQGYKLVNGLHDGWAGLFFALGVFLTARGIQIIGARIKRGRED